MAKRQKYTPMDQPDMVGPGVIYKTTDLPGSMKHLALEPEHELRKKKGDLGMTGVPAARPLSHEGKPFNVKE